MTDGIKELISKINELEGRIEKIEYMIVNDKISIKGKPNSLSGFKLYYNLSNNFEKILMIGYFLEKEKSFEHFTMDDVEDGFKKCKYPLPANMSDFFLKASGKGWLMKIGVEGRKILWTLTETGERYVEEVMKYE